MASKTNKDTESTQETLRFGCESLPEELIILSDRRNNSEIIGINLCLYTLYAFNLGQISGRRSFCMEGEIILNGKSVSPEEIGISCEVRGNYP